MISDISPLLSFPPLSFSKRKTFPLPPVNILKIFVTFLNKQKKSDEIKPSKSSSPHGEKESLGEIRRARVIGNNAY